MRPPGGEEGKGRHVVAPTAAGRIRPPAGEGGSGPTDPAAGEERKGATRWRRSRGRRSGGRRGEGEGRAPEEEQGPPHRERAAPGGATGPCAVRRRCRSSRRPPSLPELAPRSPPPLPKLAPRLELAAGRGRSQYAAAAPRPAAAPHYR